MDYLSVNLFIKISDEMQIVPLAPLNATLKSCSYQRPLAYLGVTLGLISFFMSLSPFYPLSPGKEVACVAILRIIANILY